MIETLAIAQPSSISRSGDTEILTNMDFIRPLTSGRRGILCRGGPKLLSELFVGPKTTVTTP